MPWLELTFTVPKDQASLLEAALETGGAQAVTLGDAGDDPLLEPPPGATPLWDAVRVTALFAHDPESRARAESLSRALAHLSLLPPEIETLEDQPWERAWMDAFQPTRFGRRLWVCPVGQPAPDPEGVVVALDPGLAFGTGSHPTTALCLGWLDGAELAGRTLLDYGCGSGILAIAALKLGAERVLAVDHDPQAIDATADNARANGVAGRLWVGLPEALADPALPATTDLVVANILAGPLVELAPVLIARLAPGGALALSGVLAGQVDAVRAAYAPFIDLDETRLREDWALISGSRPGHAHGPGAAP